MQRIRLQSVTFAIALSLFATAAHAWPLGRLLHLHPDAAQAKDSRISFAIYNKSGIIQDFEVADRKYTLMPNSGLTITAPEGTKVIAETVSRGHNKGDVLFAVQPTMRNDTVVIR
ncbi:MAG TPA: hypothetical protein VJU82_17260 [Acidobacteriaceae bacterium]|nr:hypothetical protein [Acidobacteriaceae bacterium]